MGISKDTVDGCLRRSGEGLCLSGCVQHGLRRSVLELMGDCRVCAFAGDWHQLDVRNGGVCSHKLLEEGEYLFLVLQS